MSAPTQQAPEEAAPTPPVSGGRHRPKRRRRTITTAVVVVVVAAAAGGGYYAVRHMHKNAPAATANPYPTSLQTVTKQSLSQQTTVDGTLGYSGSYTVLVPSGSSGGSSSGSASGAASAGETSPGGSSSGGSSSGGSSSDGTFTWLPSDGDIVHQNQKLYSAQNTPTVLLYGSVPVYRAMSEGDSGPDVKQLNRDLVALGYASKSDLDPTSDDFSSETATALKKLQDDHGLDQTGSVPVGQVVFEPGAVRVSNVTATVGAPVQPGAVVLTGTSDTRQAVAQVDPTDLPDVAVGAHVSITLPNDKTTTGTVTSIGTTASSSSSSSSGSSSSSSSSSDSSSSSSSSGDTTVNVDIRLDHPAATGSIDEAPITVDIITSTVNNVLAVPIDSIVAESSGYGVEVAGPHGSRHIVPVTLGLFDDSAGLVQVTGSGLAAGDQVVVPKI